jgi:hypothetical protein
MSQKAKIKKYLLSGKSLTPIQALDKFGCFRLASRIGELKSSGMNIVDISKKNYSKYKLEV